MPVRFNHTILPARDASLTAHTTAELLGLPAPRQAGVFWIVDLEDEASIDYIEAGEGGAYGQHIAFLVDDATFDAVWQKLRERGLKFWADPFMQHPGEINHHHGGRGVYFDDVDGNHLECITAPYGR
jgi:catechol 2,3-dioxygenase-like lactoylglutathione lyase family enzyme